MEDSVSMHMIHCLDQLIHVSLDSVLRYIVPPATDQFVNVHIHQLKDKRESTRRLIIEHLEQLDDVGVRGQSTKRLDLSQVVDLFIVFCFCLYAMYET